MTVYLNGKFLPLDEAKISVLDRGFIYGDGVYEVVPVYHRQPYRLGQHLARLQRSLNGIRLANPHADAEWEAIIHDLIARQPFADQGVYFQVTRGAAKRDHAFPANTAPTVFMMSNPLPVLSREQVEGGVAVVTAADERWLRCDLKTISLLGNVLARQFAVDNGAVETVMFRNGYLTEASASNVLIVKSGTIIAPPTDNLILPGITYDAAVELARAAGLPFATRPVPKEEALAADEMWLSSSTKEVLAVTTLDGTAFGSGRPGPVYRRMYSLFQESKPKPRRAA
ncbi:MAG TPA: D-amino acid aminotransferase [Casimicrobiaceae bacterium]|jgi:D-alanine transaminase|nr:D-amino acid aminotransferase [Casimicrobiaceae bacterium]